MKNGANGITKVEEVFVGTNLEETLAILAYRMKLTAGDLIELTDGTKAVVSANNTKELAISCVVPIFGDRYEYKYSVRNVPYNVVKAPVCGECVSFDTVMKVEGFRIACELIENGMWQDAYEMLPKLKEAGIDVSKLVEALKNKDN